MKDEFGIFLEIDVNDLLNDSSNNEYLKSQIDKKSNINNLRKNVRKNYGKNSYFNKRMSRDFRGYLKN
jgi:hypothetical protein